jgi:hypothetical protein
MTGNADQSKAAPAPAPAHRRHRAIVWTLVVLASFLLIFSILANWVQEAILDTDQVTKSTDEILADPDVQEQLSVFAVDQLYANVDVQGQIAAQLPPPAAPLAGPIAAAARDLANNVAEKALASPQVQGLVSTAVSTAHQKFVALINDEGQFVSTTGGEVTFEYGSVIADLASRLGLDGATITEIQSFIQEFSQTLRDRLTEAQSKIESTRAGLAQAQAGVLDAETEANLTDLNQVAGDLRTEIAGLEAKLAGLEDKVPSQLQDKFADLTGRLADLRKRFASIERQTAAVLKDPRSVDVEALDARLASLQGPVTELLASQAVQTPGQLVLMDSDSLSGIQTGVQALRNLGIVLPLLVFFLYMAALLLAKGWRREALIAVGGGIVVATLVVLTAKRLIGNEVGSLASSETVKPAVTSIFDILSETLRDRARFILVVGLGFIVAGVIAGPGSHAVGLRRRLAPFLRDHPVATYAIVAGVFLLWLSFLPGIQNIGQVLVIILLAVLASFGVAVLRRQTAREFAPGGDAGSA